MHQVWFFRPAPRWNPRAHRPSLPNYAGKKKKWCMIMQTEPEAQGTLFAMRTGVNSGGFALSPLESAVAKTVAAILREKPDDILAPALGELAMDLARNVTLGNRKGRAVANEAQQLASTLETMRGEVEESNTHGLPQGVIDFVDALSKRPTLDAAPAGHVQES